MRSLLFNMKPLELLILFVASYGVSLAKLVAVIAFLRISIWLFRKVNAFLDSDFGNRMGFTVFCMVSVAAIAWLLHIR